MIPFNYITLRPYRGMLLVWAFAIPLVGIAFQAQPTSTTAPAPTATQIATQEDHKKMMDLLKITTLRRGADGRNEKAPNAANYDESRIDFTGLEFAIGLIFSSGNAKPPSRKKR